MTTQHGNAGAAEGAGPQPFAVEVPQEKLDEIQRRVAEYPWEALDDLGAWRFGPPVGYARGVADHWLSSYDWRAAERELNRFPHFRCEVEGVNLHFVHEKGSGTNPEAVVLIHGWPSSPYDFWEMVEPLAHPERFDGDAEDGVDVACPRSPATPGQAGPRAVRRGVGQRRPRSTR